MSSTIRRRNKNKSDPSEPEPKQAISRTQENDLSICSENSRLNEEGLLDLYGEAETSWGKSRQVAGMILGDAVATSLFGDLNIVPVDFSKYEGDETLNSPSSTASPSSLSSPSSLHLSSAQSKELEEDSLLLDEDFVDDSLSLDRIFDKKQKNNETNIKSIESTNPFKFAQDLHSLNKLTQDTPSLKELAESIHQMVGSLESCQGTNELESDAKASNMIKLMAASCRELSTNLIKVEYELKRLEWRKPPVKKNFEPKDTPKRLTSSTVPSTSHSMLTTKDTSSPSMGTPFSSAMDEELWVLDQLDIILARSKSVPAIFWNLLEERQIALGMKASPEGGLWQDNPWQITTIGLLLLCGVGCLWAIPAVYQRWGSPFLFVAALSLQVPMVLSGPFFWADERTCSLGALIVTLGTCLTGFTVCAGQALALGLGLYKGKPRDWFPEPIGYLQDMAEFPTNTQWVFGCTAFMCLFTFFLTADVPSLAWPLVISIRCAIFYSPTLHYLVLLLNHYTIGPGKLGLHQAEVWIDLLLGMSLSCLFVALLLLRWIFSGFSWRRPGGSSNQHSTSLSVTTKEEDSLSTTERDPFEAFAQQKKSEHYREFLAIGCDVSIILFWISFSRIDKGHSMELEIVYGLVNCLLIVLSLISRRKALLVGLFGLGWYQGHRAVDVFNRSKHYAKSILLYDDFCVLIRCVDPMKSRPDW